jgi:hypothetical protein
MAAPAHIARENGKKGGRPKGSETAPQFRDFVSDEDRNEFVEFVLSTYKESERLTMWVGDHLFLKLPQTMTSEDGEPITVAGFVFLRNENNKAGDPGRQLNKRRLGTSCSTPPLALFYLAAVPAVAKRGSTANGCSHSATSIRARAGSSAATRGPVRRVGQRGV